MARGSERPTTYQLSVGEKGLDRFVTLDGIAEVPLPVVIGSEALEGSGTARRIRPAERAEIEQRLKELQD